MACKHISKETCINKGMYYDIIKKIAIPPNPDNCQQPYIELEEVDGQRHICKCNGYEEETI